MLIRFGDSRYLQSMVDYEKPVRSAYEVLERACALAGLVTAFTMERDYLQIALGDRQKFAQDYSYLTRVYRSTPPRLVVHSGPAECGLAHRVCGPSRMGGQSRRHACSL
jgi:hypothetical protein